VTDGLNQPVSIIQYVSLIHMGSPDGS